MPTPRELLDRLETRHDELLRKLDELNAQIEVTLVQFGKARAANVARIETATAETATVATATTEAAAPPPTIELPAKKPATRKRAARRAA